MDLLIASNNQDKIKEIKTKFNESNLTINILSPRDLNLSIDAPDEIYDTLEDNALLKAKYYSTLVNLPCISDDSGLFVNALNGSPGVFSAYYAGSPTNYANNNAKLIQEMREITDRTAYFASVICYYDKSTHHFFEGRCQGRIATKIIGQNGFGYDPIFIPDGFTKSFGELDNAIKSAISHRTIAVNKFINHLKI